MGEPNWLEDPRFVNDKTRGDHGELISERMVAWCSTRTSAEVLSELEQVKIPAGPVLSPQQVLEDAHVKATGFLRGLTVPGSTAEAPVGAQNPGCTRSKSNRPEAFRIVATSPHR